MNGELLNVGGVILACCLVLAALCLVFWFGNDDDWNDRKYA